MRNRVTQGVRSFPYRRSTAIGPALATQGGWGVLFGNLDPVDPAARDENAVLGVIQVMSGEHPTLCPRVVRQFIRNRTRRRSIRVLEDDSCHGSKWLTGLISPRHVRAPLAPTGWSAGGKRASAGLFLVHAWLWTRPVEGFTQALNGYFDVDDALARYLRRRAAREFAAERAEKRALESPQGVEARQETVRETFLEAIGGLPGRMDDPSVETMGSLTHDGYEIERVVLESRPNFHVTTNCYMPAGEGPHPAILFLCGHVQAAKADPTNQKACIELAQNGILVLIIDPIAQGEREQYRDPETGEAVVRGGGGVFPHCYAGHQCFYAGGNLARYLIHDARRGLDYLRRRRDVDNARIGVTGASGGGTQAQYLGLIDDRVAAVAPVCAVTEREEWLKTGKRVDAEQAIRGAIAQGINYDDFLAAQAPRPLCIGAAASDEYFPIEGVYEAYERTARAYELCGSPDDVELIVAQEPHCSVYDLGGRIFEWFCQALGAGAYDPQNDHPVHDASALNCTTHGSVRDAYEEERTIDDLIGRFASTSGTGMSRRQGGSSGPGQVRQAVRKTFDLDRERTTLHPRYVRTDRVDGLTVEYVYFMTERDPDAIVSGVVVSEEGVSDDRPAVVLFEEGTDELPHRQDEVASLAAEHGTVFVFDPRGTGAVRNRPIPIPSWVTDYYGIYGTEFKLGYDALLLGESLFGMRVYDVCRAIEFLMAKAGNPRDENSAGGIDLIGEGIGAYQALYAAVAEDGIGSLELRDLGPGFRQMATDREFPYDPRLTVFDVIDNCDVPDALGALADRSVRVVRKSD